MQRKTTDEALMFCIAFIHKLIYNLNAVGSIKTYLFAVRVYNVKRLVRWSASYETQSAGVARQPTSHLLALAADVKIPSYSNVPTKTKCVIKTKKLVWVDIFLRATVVGHFSFFNVKTTNRLAR